MYACAKVMLKTQYAETDMSYFREIPRDLFNEANLQKCLATASINAETTPGVEVEFLSSDGYDSFDIYMNEDDGSLRIRNVVVQVHGEIVDVFRPLNSREAYPLLFTIEKDGDYDCLKVFTPEGKFSDDFQNYVESMKPKSPKNSRSLDM